MLSQFALPDRKMFLGMLNNIKKWCLDYQIPSSLRFIFRSSSEYNILIFSSLAPGRNTKLYLMPLGLSSGIVITKSMLG